MKRDELREVFEKDKAVLIETEKERYNKKFLLMKNEIKSEYEQILQVNNYLDFS